MMNKKALGLHWYIAALAFVISMGVLAWGNTNTKIPLVGEYSASIANAMENGNNIPLEVEGIMNQLNHEASLSYESHKVFALDSYCNDIFDVNGNGITEENSNYKNRILAANPGFNTPSVGELNHFTTRANAKCYADEDELMKYYEEAFSKEYAAFKSTAWINLNLDFSSVDYISEVINEVDIVKKYFNLLKTTNGFTIPMVMQDKKGVKNIGSFNVKPNFKLETQNPVNKPFDKTEACIFAADCGATCHDVIERNPGSNYVLIEKTIASSKCEDYFDCATPTDQFGKTFSCSKESPSNPNNPILCRGQCLPFCSASPDYVTDADASTKCTEFSCSSYTQCSSVSSSTCGCPDPSLAILNDACIGNDCQTLDCSKDSEYEGRDGVITSCKDQCSNYGDCLSTDSCSCPFLPYMSLESCVGSCYCNQQPTYKGSCGGESCSSNQKPIYRDYDPLTCHSRDFLGCTACDPSCDSCGCSYEPACDCGGNSCCIEDSSLCLPEPPADDSCEGRCREFDDSKPCQCDSACLLALRLDCCADISTWC